MNEHPGFLKSIERIVFQAGRIILETADRGIGTKKKSSNELVTTADLASERFLREKLTALDPGAGFLGEESSEGTSPSPPFWVVDPLDGTNNFAHGFPVFAVSVAYRDVDSISFACIHDPLRNETFSASKGGGAFLNGTAIHCTNRTSLSECLVATGFPYRRGPGNPGVDFSVLAYFLERVQGLRRAGSAALDLAYVACGRLDCFYEESLKPWDMAAGILLVREAGGRVTAYEGGEWTMASRGVAASGKHIHDALRKGVESSLKK